MGNEEFVIFINRAGFLTLPNKKTVQFFKLSVHLVKLSEKIKQFKQLLE